MNVIPPCVFAALVASTLATAAWAEEARPIFYEVSFKNGLVATQTVTITQTPDEKTVTASFEAEVPVFVAHHRIAEDLSVTTATNGAVIRFHANRMDGPIRIEIVGTAESDGMLRVVRSDRAGSVTNYIARDAYDFNSLILYGNPTTDFVTTNQPARVLDIAEGHVVPVQVSGNSESLTVERQNVKTLHVTWVEGAHTSHSWHPERFSNLPVRYIRQTDAGEFTFFLQR